MDFKSMLTQLSQLSEGTQETEKGRVHKAEPGGYGRKFDTDEEGDEDKKGEKKEPAVKRGRGRPKKGADSETGQVAKYDNAKNLQSFMVGNLPKGKLPGKPGKKHSIKEWIQEVENKYVAEGQLDELSPATLRSYSDKARNQAERAAGIVKYGGQYDDYRSQEKPQYRDKLVTDPDVDYGPEDSRAKFSQKRYAGANRADAKLNDKRVKEAAPGQQLTVKPMPGAAQLVDPASNKVMATGDAAAVKNIQGAVAQGKVQMRGEEMTEDGVEEAVRGMTFAPVYGPDGNYINGDDTPQRRRPQNQRERDHLARGIKQARSDNKYAAGLGIKKPTYGSASGVSQGNDSEEVVNTNKDGTATVSVRQPGITRGSMFKTGTKTISPRANDGKNIKEADIPSDQVDMGAGLGAGRNSKTFEGKKPDFPDIDNDKNTKEPISKAAQDAEKKKKKLKENAHRHSAAKLLGKAHALARESYNCKYDDLDEVRMYHEGYKEGLDECYGQGVYETAPAMPPATPGGMAGQAMPAMEEDMFDEGNAFTAALAKTPKGGKFSVGGKSFTDTSSYDSHLDEFAFESLDKQLNALLNEDSVSEGMSVSISKGQQGMPDSVSVTAQDGEAEQLLSMIKQAGLGLFGNDEKPEGFGQDVTGMSLGGEEAGRDSADIGVVDDHDDMMALIKKIVGNGGPKEPEEVGAGSDEGHDYGSEEGHDHEGHEHTEESSCNECGYMESQCQCDEEAVMGEEESYDQEEEEVAEDNPPDSDAAETSADEDAEAQEDQALATADEEQVTEWANDAGKKAEDFNDEQFETDMNFITKSISGGLNKQKSTGQTTIPVIASQTNRQVAHESINDWIKLAGIK